MKLVALTIFAFILFIALLQLGILMFNYINPWVSFIVTPFLLLIYFKGMAKLGLKYLK